MSRNIRQKRQRVKAPASKRRVSNSSSSLHLSDDDGYSAVEDVSDSDEDDESHVNAAEEKHLISLEERKRSSGSSRPEQETSEDADEEDEDEEGEDDEGEQDNTSWDGILSDIDDATAAGEQPGNYILNQDVANVERRVRFAGVPDSDSESTASDASEEVDGFFPDIFVEQSSLDPAFRREIEVDEDSSNSGSFWDLHGSQDPWADSEADETVPVVADEGTPTAAPAASQQPLSAVSTPAPLVEAQEELQELDGYETDGDTTEEDSPEPASRKKQAKRCPSVEATSDSDTERPVRFRRGQPRVGRFNLDSSEKKPIAVVNHLTRKMMIFTTPQRARQFDLAPESFEADYNSPGVTQSSPIFSNSASLMMSAMVSSNTFGDFMNTQPFGPAEAFFPFTSDAITGDESDEFDVEEEDDEDEEEKNLKLEDFITFHNESSDDEEDADTPRWSKDGQADPTSTPTRPRTAASTASAVSDMSITEANTLLRHFDNNSDLVGAFRRNQINQQLIFSEKASHESLAFSGPYYHGTLRGIKNGSIEAVSTPITPVRRQKRNSLIGMGNIPDVHTSPLQSVSQKRKASGPLADSLHKRHRSISDMNMLQI